MAFNIDISDLKVCDGADELLSTQYDVYCFRSASAYAKNGLNAVPVNPGNNMLLVVGKDKWFDAIQKTIEAYVDPSSADIALEHGGVQYSDQMLSVIYDGKPICPIPRMRINGSPVNQHIPGWSGVFTSENTNPINFSFDDYIAYEIQYSDNVNASDSGAFVIVNPNPRHASNAHSKMLTFYIMPASLTYVENIKGLQHKIRYSPSTESKQTTLSVEFNGMMLNEGIDYTMSYGDTSNLGNANFVVYGIGNFTGDVHLEYQITADLESSSAKLYSDYACTKLIENCICSYTGNVIHPPVHVKLDNVLALHPEDGQYFSEYPDSIHPGAYQGKLIGSKDCIGTSCEFTYGISSYINVCSFQPSPSQIPVFDYTGEPIKPEVQVSLNGEMLQQGIDYSYAYDPNDTYISSGMHSFKIAGASIYWHGFQEFSYLIAGSEYTKIFYSDSMKILEPTVTSLTRHSLGLTTSTNYTINRVVIGSNVTQCEAGLLSGCKNLVDADFGYALGAEIPEACFDGCNSLQTVEFPGEHTTNI